VAKVKILLEGRIRFCEIMPKPSQVGDAISSKRPGVTSGKASDLDKVID
jgi:hypothetical protein